ncbi:MAG TPA: hypothetical protein VK699_18745 [Terriglobales bacterium]|nr:hypothetical protein [Terriglobales bacterium]
MRIKPYIRNVLALCFVPGMTAFHPAHAQSNAPTLPKNPQTSAASVTSHDDASANTTDALRKKRSDRYNSPPGTPPLDDDSYLVVETASSDQTALPGLPANNSDAIIVGSIVAQHAYLSSDRTVIYSEFKVLVEQNLKAPKDFPLHTGNSIDVERQGGEIRFASGVTLSRGVANQSLPWVGKRYLFFLQYRPDEKDFFLITGYRLEGAQVTPLDNTKTVPAITETNQNKDALPTPLPDPRTEFIYGTSEAQLLAKVKALIASGTP